MQPVRPAYRSRWLPLRRFLIVPSVLIICLLFVGFTFSHVSQAASAMTWYVAPTGNDGNDCLTTITACKTVGGAVAKAGGGDRVSVATGVYTEHLILDKSLTITGAGADATILEGV